MYSDVRDDLIILVAEHPLHVVISEIGEAKLLSPTEVNAHCPTQIVLFPGQPPSRE
jgi:hypothetical protein